MNLGDIETGLYDRLGYGPNPESSVIRKIRALLNIAHRTVLTKRGCASLRRKTLTAACAANDPLMVLPQAVASISVITDRLHQLPLGKISLQEIRRRDPGLLFTSVIPESYTVINWASPVAIEPSVPSSLFAISDSTADGTGLSVIVEGIVTGGYRRRAVIAMNGTTAVNLDSTVTTWIAVSKFYLSGPAKGSITLRQTSGVGTELSRITPGRASAKYTQIHLSGTPGSVLTYYCDVELQISDMVDPYDEPLLPEDFQYILEAGVLKEWSYGREKLPMWKIKQKDWDDGVKDLLAHLSRESGVANQRRRGYSQLGPWFPDGA